jgi:hypothetical protein
VVGLRGECRLLPPGRCREDGNSPGLIGQTCDQFLGHCDLALGACCDGITCVITTWDECWGTEMPWVEGQGCLPGDGNTCLQEWGACCVGPDCVIARRPDCGAQFSPGEGCYPGQGGNIEACVAVPTESRSWGRIKSIYNRP